VKILLGHHGQRGDLAINLPAIEYLHRTQGWQIDMPVNRAFADMLPLFANLPYLNSVIVTEAYESMDFPSEADQKLIEARGYGVIFDPMASHREDQWWRRMHQTSCVLYDYADGELPSDAQQIHLTKWWLTGERLKRVIAFAPFAGFYHPGNAKTLTPERAQEIVNALNCAGYMVAQLHGPGEPELDNVTCVDRPYFEAVRDMLDCALLLHTDTGMGWICSGYQHPQVGLYSHGYYGVENVGNIQPRNPNSRYLAAPNVNEIPVEQIVEAVRQVAP
jgi:ADP-heptose:LPS heptosyltransferase